MKKRILSIVLVFCMMLTLLPGNSFAEGTEVASVTTSEGVVTQYTDFNSAFNAANENSGSTIKLLNNASAAYDGAYGFLNINNKITFDLNGYTLTLDKYILSTNAETADFTINDSSAVGTGKITSTIEAIYNLGGKLTINGGSFEASSIAINIDNPTAVTIINGGFFSGKPTLIRGNGRVALYGGTYNSSIFSVRVADGTVNDLLPEGYCYYDTAGNVFIPAADATYIEQTVSIGEIDWSKAVTYDDSAKTYTLYSAGGLRWISGISNGTVTADTYKNDPVMPADKSFAGYTAKLVADIDLSGKNWMPINEFHGTFDGVGHKITNMTINDSYASAAHIGFINQLYGKVKNLYVGGSVTVTSNNVYAGGIAGYMEFDSGIYNCVSDINVSVTATNSFAGGIAGKALQAEILNCIYTGTAAAIGEGSFAGALVGNADETTITNCYARDTVTINKDGCINLPIISSIGSFDTDGNLTPAKGCVFIIGGTIQEPAIDCTLEYGTTLKQAMQGWVMRQGIDAVNYVTWTADAIPTLTTNYSEPHTHSFVWEKQADGSYISTCTECGEQVTAEACVTSGSNVVPYATLEEAITAAQSASGSTVKLLINVTTEKTVQVSSGTFTIDLNGKTWTADLPDGSNALLLDGTSNVTLKDSGTNGKFTSNAVDTEHGYKSTVYAQSAFTIESGIYDNTNNNPSLYVNGVQSNINITGGIFKGNVTFENCENIMLSGGNYDYICTENNGDESKIGTIGELLANGYGYRYTAGSSHANEWATVTDTSDIDNITVQKAPVKITEQTPDTAIAYGTSTTLSVTAQKAEGVDVGKEITYKWYKYNGTEYILIEAATDASYSLPNDLAAGSYQYFCVVSCDGYSVNSKTITVTVNKATGSIANKNYATSYIFNRNAVTAPAAVNFTFNVPAESLVFTWYKENSTTALHDIPSDVGTYTLKVTSAGSNNIAAAECTVPVEVKYLETEVVATKSPDKEWYNADDFKSNISIKVNPESHYEIYFDDPFGGSSGDEIIVNEYVKDNGSIVDGPREVKYQLYLYNDMDAGLSDFKSIIFNVDVTAPNIGIPTYSEHRSFLGWLFHNSKLDVTVPVSDAVSGADHISYVLTPEGGTAQDAQTANVDASGNATFTVEKNFKGAIAITAYDKAGNASGIVDINKMFIEDTKPTLTVNDGTDEFTDNWYTTAQTLHVSAADDDSGIKSITYTVDGSSATTLFEAKNTDSSLTEAKDGLTIVAVDGEHTYTVTVTDNALNTITTAVTVKQDTVLPTLSKPVAPTGDKLTDTTATVTFTASEAGSFCYTVQKNGDQTPTVDELLENETHSMTTDSNNTISLTELEPNTGYTLYFAAKDMAGNKTAQVTSISFTTAKTSIAGATVTVNEDTFTYNGLSQKPAVTVKLGDNTLTADTDYTVTYSNSNGGADNTTNAGTVTVTVTAVSNGSYSGTATDTAAYTIEKAVLTPSISGTTTKEYDGGTTVDSGMSISLSGIQNNENVTASASYAYDNKNAGTEKTVNANGITLTGDNGNYILSADTASADVGTITARKVTVNILGDSTYIYNSKAEYTLTASYPTVDGDTADVTIKYDGSSDKPEDVKLDKGSVTAYTLTAVINDDNYELTTTTGTIEFTITQATITAKNTGKSLHYSKTAQQTVTASDFGIIMDGTFAANGDVIDADRVLSSMPIYADTVKYQLKSGITFDAQNPQAVTIPITFTPKDTNYTTVNVTLTVTLTDKDTVTLALTADKTADVTYGDSVTYTAELDKEHVFLDALQSLDGTIKFYLGDVDTGEPLATENVSSSDKTVSITLTYDKLKAGNHTVTAVYSGNTDFASTQTATTTSVAKKAVTVKPKDVSITSGSTVPVFELVFNGLIGSETLDISQVPVLECKKDGNTVDGKTAGTYTITWANEATSTIIDGTGKAANYEITKLATGTLTVSNPSNGGGNSSGGASSPGNGTSVGSVIVPVSNGLGEIKVSATVSGTIATVSVNDMQLKEITSAAGNTRNVKMDLSGLKVDTVVIPSNVISAAKGSSSSTGLEVVLPTGAVVLDNKALGSVENKGEIKISVEEVKSVALTDEQKAALGTQAGTISVVDVNVYANGIKISAFGSGKINVSVPYTLKDGEKAENITVWFMKDDGTIEPKKGLYNTKTGKVEFTTEHLSQYFIVNFPFIDVAQNAWYYGSVAYAYNNGMFSGTGDKIFDPNLAMTRGMLVTVLWCMEGKPTTDTGSFTDVASGAYYKDAISWASANGIVNGYGNGKFGPDNSITREQMATILYHYAIYKKYDTTQGGMAVREFADYDNISEYALPALGWAVNSGIMNGSGNKLTPKDNATRAQVAAVLMHFRKNIMK